MNNNTTKNNFLLDVFARIWAVWGIITFIATFLIFFLPSMGAYLFANEKKGQAYFIAISKLWMNIWLPLAGCPLTIRGKAHFKKDENYVVVFNHNALMDVPLSAPYVPGANKTIAKASFAKVPLFGLFYKRGSILVDRKREKSRIQSYEEMKRTLRNGMHMCIYPEGTRNRTTEPLKQFYDGAFKLAVETNKAIIPCIITGTKKAMPVHKTFYLLPAKLGMHFLPPVSPEGLDAKALKEKVFNIMLEEYTKSSK